MIPNLSVTAYNRYDLLEKMFHSIDFPIGEICLLVNSQTRKDQEALGRIVAASKSSIKIVEPGFNIGVPAAWNFFIRRFMHQHGVALITQDDIQFRPGALEKFHAKVTESDSADLVCGFSYGMFAIRQSALDKIGYFDENFYPIYFEDTDYRRRILVFNEQSKDKKFVVEQGDQDSFIHEHEATRKTLEASSPDEHSRYMGRVGVNMRYYARKWGGDPVNAPRWGTEQGQETFTTPFNNPDLTLKNWITGSETDGLIYRD